MDSLTTLISDPSAWAALVTLVVMEVVLGIDNLVFISILTNKLPLAQRAGAQRIGIGLALVMRQPSSQAGCLKKARNRITKDSHATVSFAGRGRTGD